MGITTLYYFIAFILFIGCIIGIQKWFLLPQQKKDKVGLLVLSIFLGGLIAFVCIVIFKPNYLSTETVMSAGILFVFLLIVFTAFFTKWYNNKYHKKINTGSVIIAMSLTIFAGAYLVLKSQGNSEKENLVKNVQLKTVVTNITFDSHKPYFKDMTLADGQYLPMPEAMNTTLQIGDSIYKNKGDEFYTVVNAKTKDITKIAVKVHERVLGKAQ